MIAQLKQESVIGVDAEFTLRNTYYQYICLLQISTRTSDFLVDPLSPQLQAPKGAPPSTPSPMYQLNEVFTDPRIVKVLHYGQYDIPYRHSILLFKWVCVCGCNQWKKRFHCGSVCHIQREWYGFHVFSLLPISLSLTLSIYLYLYLSLSLFHRCE